MIDELGREGDGLRPVARRWDEDVLVESYRLKVSEMKNHGRSRFTTLQLEDMARVTSGVIDQEKEQERKTSNPSADGNFEVEESGIERKILSLYSFFNFQLSTLNL
jgi:hypothetical protein